MEWLYLTVSVALIAACGLFVAAEFALRHGRPGDVDRPLRRAPAARRGAPPRAALPVDPAVRCPGRHHASPTWPSASSPSPRSPTLLEARWRGRRPGRRGARASRSRVGARLRDPAHHALRRAGAEEPRDRQPAGDGPRCPGFSAASPRLTAAGRSGCSTALPTRWCAASASSRRRSCASARSPQELLSLVAPLGRSRAPWTPTPPSCCSAPWPSATALADDDHDPARAHGDGRRGPPRCSTVIELARATGHSRFPVVGDGDADDVVGRRAREARPGGPAPDARRASPVRDLMVPPVPIVPATLRARPAARALRAGGLQLAVVIDEFGGIAGLVTARGPRRGARRGGPGRARRGAERRRRAGRTAPGRCPACCARTRSRSCTGVGAAGGRRLRDPRGARHPALGRMPGVGDGPRYPSPVLTSGEGAPPSP